MHDVTLSVTSFDSISASEESLFFVVQNQMGMMGNPYGMGSGMSGMGMNPMMGMVRSPVLLFSYKCIILYELFEW